VSSPPQPSREFLRLWRELFPQGDFRSLSVLARVRYLGTGVRWAIIRLFYDLWPLFVRIEEYEDEETGTVVRRTVIDEGKLLEWLASKEEEKRVAAERFMKYYAFLQQIVPIQLSLSPGVRDAAMRLLGTVTLPKIQANYVVEGGRGRILESIAEIHEIPEEEETGRKRRRRKRSEEMPEGIVEMEEEIR